MEYRQVATPSKMRSKIAQEILDEMEPKHSDLVREYGALWLENDQQAIQIKALKEQLQAAAESLRLHKELVDRLFIEFAIVIALAFVAATAAIYYVFYFYDWFTTNILLNGN